MNEAILNTNSDIVYYKTGSRYVQCGRIIKSHIHQAQVETYLLTTVRLQAMCAS